MEVTTADLLIPNEDHEKAIAELEAKLASLNLHMSKVRKAAAETYESRLGGSSFAKYILERARDDFGFALFEVEQAFKESAR